MTGTGANVGARVVAASEVTLGGRRPSASRGSIRIVLPSRTAEFFAVLFHHRIQNLTTGMNTQIEEGIFDTCECP